MIKLPRTEALEPQHGATTRRANESSHVLGYSYFSFASPNDCRPTSGSRKRLKEAAFMGFISVSRDDKYFALFQGFETLNESE